MKFKETRIRFPKGFSSFVLFFIVMIGLLGMEASFLNEGAFEKNGFDIGTDSSIQKKTKKSIGEDIAAFKEHQETAFQQEEKERGKESSSSMFSEAQESVSDLAGPSSISLLDAPKNIKAIYLTAQTALSWRQDDIFSLVEKTELNSIVVNVKDGLGIFQGPSMKEFVEKAKAKGIWTIARFVVMQDNSLVAQRPHLALLDEKGNAWKDAAGLYWVDPASREVWDYNVQVAKEIIDLGFDELNFDYIRFPSDGITEHIRYPYWSRATPKHEVMKQFFAYLAGRLREYKPDIYLSADLFAHNLLSSMSFDSVVGQHVEEAALYFDVISPMIYPSHFLPGNFGFENPAEHPYEVVSQTLTEGRAKIWKVRDRAVIRPWLQAFDMGAPYTKEMIDLEKKAVEDAGFDYGWMLWNPNNAYPFEWFGQ